MKRFLSFAVLLFCIGPLISITCGGKVVSAPGPTGPDPFPSASSTPPPPPLTPLHATPQGFRNEAGQVVRLRGVSYIPPDGKLSGWPSWIDDDILKEISDAGGNFVAVRLGPYSRDGEGIPWVPYESVGDLSRVNLDHWNPAFWLRVRAFAEQARSRGIYVEFDLIDAWVLERPSLSPWSAGGNVNGYDGGSCDAITGDGPDRRQQDWLNKIAWELGDLPNVIFQISNESGDGNCNGKLNPAWELGVYRGFKSALRWRGVERPVGTNSHNGTVESGVDYVERHACVIPHLLVEKPVGVNEWTCGLTPEQFCSQQKALGEGEWFLIWGDGLTQEEWKEMLKCLK